MKISENFDIRELVHPDIYAAHGERCVDFINPYLPVTLEALKRNLHEIIIINDWHMGGNFKSSGVRTPLEIPSKHDVSLALRENKDFDDAYKQIVSMFKGVGAALSTHKFGCTADTKYKYHTISEVFDHIISDPRKYPYITRIESIQHTPTWLHIEVGVRSGDIIVFNP